MSFLRKKFWQIPAILVIQYVFWMLFFAICRLVFLVYNQEEVRKAPSSEILLTFPEAIYVDTAITCYILAIPMLVLIVSGFTGFKYGLKIIQVYSILILFLISLLTLAELPIYDEWSHKLTYKALWFLQQPSEVFHTASVAQLLLAVIGTSTLTWVGYRLYKKGMSFPSPIVKDYLSSGVFLLIAPFIVLTGMRGGYAPIPVQVSDAYFSHYNILNAASVNSTFHLVSNIIQNLEAYEPYTFLKPEEALVITDSLHAVPQDTTIHFLTTTRPNVVLVVFEGWAADVIEALGGYSGVAPNFSKLIQQGVSFDSCYASGNLSDQGMAAVFSAFPAQPRSSIISVPNKYVHLPCINTEFKKNGYATSFLFGGQLSYGNIRSYMYYNGFDRIQEEKDFASSVYRGRLGVHDGDLYDRELQELKSEKQPFFASMFTLSTHGPYDIPVGDVLHWGEKENGYINTVHYADSCLNHFIEQASKQPWFDNTLFVFVSDHHHNTPKSYSYFSPEYRRIPLVFYGNVIKPEFRGMKYHQICSQLDLASTLLHQLNMDASPFVWSKNLFNPFTPQLAIYSFDEGFGIVRPQEHLVYHIHENRFEFEKYLHSSSKPRLAREGKAYMQRVSEEFWKY